MPFIKLKRTVRFENVKNEDGTESQKVPEEQVKYLYYEETSTRPWSSTPFHKLAIDYNSLTFLNADEKEKLESGKYGEKIPIVTFDDEDEKKKLKITDWNNEQIPIEKWKNQKVWWYGFGKKLKPLEKGLNAGYEWKGINLKKGIPFNFLIEQQIPYERAYQRFLFDKKKKNLLPENIEKAWKKLQIQLYNLSEPGVAYSKTGPFIVEEILDTKGEKEKKEYKEYFKGSKKLYWGNTKFKKYTDEDRSRYYKKTGISFYPEINLEDPDKDEWQKIQVKKQKPRLDKVKEEEAKLLAQEKPNGGRKKRRKKRRKTKRKKRRKTKRKKRRKSKRRKRTKKRSKSRK